MYQTLGKIAILLPLLFIVGYSERAQAYSDDYEGTDGTNLTTYSSDYASTTDSDYKIYNDFAFTGNTSMGCKSSCSSTGDEPKIPLSLVTGTTGTYKYQISFYEDTINKSLSNGHIISLQTLSGNEACGILRASEGNSYHFTFSPDSSPVAIDLVAPNATTTNEWHTAWIIYDYDNNLCTGGIDEYSTTTSVVATGYPDPTYLVIGYQNNSDFYFDDLITSASSIGDSSCTTCTRIVSTDPTTGESVPYSTSWDYYVDYYVANSDYSPGETFIRLNYQHALYYPHLINGYSIAHEQFTSSVLNALDNTAIFNFAYAYATGTYNVNIEIYRTVDPPWWNFWSDPTNETLVMYNTTFYIDTPTSLTEYQTAQQNAENNMLFINPADYPCDLNDIKCMILDFSSTTLHGVPFGYATRIYEILQATTSSSTDIGLAFTFPTTSPASGKTISLSASDAITEAQSKIGVDFMDKLMTLWNLLWYILLILWIIKQVFKFRMV